MNDATGGSFDRGISEDARLGVRHIAAALVVGWLAMAAAFVAAGLEAGAANSPWILALLSLGIAAFAGLVIVLEARSDFDGLGLKNATADAPLVLIALIETPAHVLAVLMNTSSAVVAAVLTPHLIYASALPLEPISLVAASMVLMTVAATVALVVDLTIRLQLRRAGA